ncbi:MAG: hypothetical protein WDZ49_16715, partial [Litorilinea sp.]
DWAVAVRTETIAAWNATYRAYCAYLENDSIVEYRGYKASGLNLSDEILNKLYLENATRIYRNL